MLRGGGKYSSSSVTRTSSMPFVGLRNCRTSSTSSSGAEAPAVTPTWPNKSCGSSLALLMRRTRLHPESIASRSRARVFDELDEPITMMLSHRSAICMRALWRFVVAKQRSLRPGDHTSVKRFRTASATPSQSRCERVVCASSAKG